MLSSKLSSCVFIGKPASGVAKKSSESLETTIDGQTQDSESQIADFDEFIEGVDPRKQDLSMFDRHESRPSPKETKGKQIPSSHINNKKTDIRKPGVVVPMHQAPRHRDIFLPRQQEVSYLNDIYMDNIDDSSYEIGHRLLHNENKEDPFTSYRHSDDVYDDGLDDIIDSSVNRSEESGGSMVSYGRPVGDRMDLSEDNKVDKPKRSDGRGSKLTPTQIKDKIKEIKDKVRILSGKEKSKLTQHELGYLKKVKIAFETDDYSGL